MRKDKAAISEGVKPEVKEPEVKEPEVKEPEVKEPERKKSTGRPKGSSPKSKEEISLEIKKEDIVDFKEEPEEEIPELYLAISTGVHVIGGRVFSTQAGKTILLKKGEYDVLKRAKVVA